MAKKATQSKNPYRVYYTYGLVALGIIILAALLFLALRGPAPIEGLMQSTGLARGHNAELVIEYGELPPTGGEHNPVWQNCGIYDTPVEAQYALHSMEHGAVWITYQPELASDELAALRDKAEGNSFVLMSPYPGQSSPIVLTAWGVQVEIASADDDRIDRFIDLYQVGPQTPERGASCTDGIGTPIG